MGKLIHIIILKYWFKGEIKIGIIKIHFTINYEEHVINYQRMELSDHYPPISYIS